MPFHVWPVYDHREIEAVTGVIESLNWWRYSHGESSGLNQTAAEAQSHVGRFQTAFAEYHGCRYGIAAANGTDSLNLIKKALGIGPEVIVPPYAFIATATCVLEVNAIPVFVAALQAEGIPVSTGYPFPLYKNAMFRNQDFWAKGCPLACGYYPEQVSFAGYQEKCPAAEEACQEALWLPQQLLLGSERDMDDIAAACAKIATSIASLLTAA